MALAVKNPSDTKSSVEHHEHGFGCRSTCLVCSRRSWLSSSWVVVRRRSYGLFSSLEFIGRQRKHLVDMLNDDGCVCIGVAVEKCLLIK